MTDEKTRQLENRIDTIENTIEKMMPSRRDALKMGGAALIGGAAMSGTASAGTNQKGTIGASPNDLVDIESEDINNADTITTDSLTATNNDSTGTVTTDDLVVNGTATGPFGPVLEAGDTITVGTISGSNASQSMVTLYNDTAKDVLGGTISSDSHCDFTYTFSDNTTLAKQGGDAYDFGNLSGGRDTNGDKIEVDFLPPALDVTKIEVGGNQNGGSQLAAEVYLKD